MVLHLLPPELQEMVVSLLPISSRAGEHFLKSSYSDPFFCLNLNSPQSSLGGVPPLAPLPLHADPLLNHLHNQPAERPARLGAKRSRQPALVLRCARPERDLARVAHLLRGTSLQGQECTAGGFHYWQWLWQNKIWYWWLITFEYLNVKIIQIVAARGWTDSVGGNVTFLSPATHSRS